MASNSEIEQTHKTDPKNDENSQGFTTVNAEQRIENNCQSKDDKVKSVIEDLSSQAEKLVEEINIKRKQDSQLLTKFRGVLEKQTMTACEEIENALYQEYDQNGTRLQEKLQALYAALDRISKLETELAQFRSSLDLLCQDAK